MKTRHLAGIGILLFAFLSCTNHASLQSEMEAFTDRQIVPCKDNIRGNRLFRGDRCDLFAKTLAF